MFTRVRRIVVSLVAALATTFTTVSPASALPAIPNYQTVKQATGQCRDNMVYVVAPSAMSLPILSEKSQLSVWASQFANAFKLRNDTVSKILPYNAQWVTGLISYNNSVRDGVNRLENMLIRDNQACPNTAIHMAGYSEGADVIGYTFQDIIACKVPGISPERVKSVVRMSAPSRQSGEGVNTWGTAQGGRGFNEPLHFGKYSNRVLEMCNWGDAVCDTERLADRFIHVVQATQGLSFTPPWIEFDKIANLINNTDGLDILMVLVTTPAFLGGWAIHGSTYNLLGGITASVGFIMQRMI